MSTRTRLLFAEMFSFLTETVRQISKRFFVHFIQSVKKRFVFSGYRAFRISHRNS